MPLLRTFTASHTRLVTYNLFPRRSPRLATCIGRNTPLEIRQSRPEPVHPHPSRLATPTSMSIGQCQSTCRPFLVISKQPASPKKYIPGYISIPKSPTPTESPPQLWKWRSSLSAVPRHPFFSCQTSLHPSLPLWGLVQKRFASWGTDGARPRFPRSRFDEEVISTNVEVSRDILFKETAVVQVVPCRDILKSLGGSVPVSRVKRTCDRLKASGAIRKSDGKWNARIISKGEEKKTEEGYYRCLPRIFEAITKADGGVFTCTLVHQGRKRPGSHRSNSALPDGGFVLAETASTTVEKALGSTWDYLIITAPSEFKLEDQFGKQIDNTHKVFWSMHHVLSNDPRRQFVFGFTVEETKLRVHFLSWGKALVSTALDLYSDWQEVVKLFLFFGTAKRVDLGFDDTVTLVQVEKGIPTFEFSLQKSVYRTIGLISNRGTRRLTGSGHRVWKVREVTEAGFTGPERILSDRWVPASKRREHEILDELQQRLGNDKRSAHFVKILTHSSITSGDTFQRHWRVKPLSAAGLMPLHRGAGSTESTGEDNLSARKIKHPSLVRYRKVCEMGYPVYQLSSLASAFATLQGALCGIGAMHDVGWIHRDIHISNILLVDRSGGTAHQCEKCSSRNLGLGMTPVLIDFESAHEDDDSVADITNTALEEFLPAELALNDWCLSSSLSELPKDRNTRVPMPPFRHHCFHDVEPIKWIAKWLLFHRLVPTAKQTLPPGYNFSSNSVDNRDGMRASVIDSYLWNGLPPIYQAFVRTLAFWLWDRDIERCREEVYPKISKGELPVSGTLQWSRDLIQASSTHLKALEDVATSPDLQVPVETFPVKK